MARFRKLPLEVEAVPASHLIQAAQHMWTDLPEWIRDAYDRGNIIFLPHGIHIHTLEGPLIANYDDWIIQGIRGEIYPCRQDIFNESYALIAP